MKEVKYKAVQLSLHACLISKQLKFPDCIQSNMRVIIICVCVCVCVGGGGGGGGGAELVM